MELELSIDNKHLEALAASPQPAILELIWNALDADAKRVEVVLAKQEMGGIGEIRIVDDGHGMTHEDARSAFELLGGSWKKEGGTSQGLGRALHGQSGQGRFRAAGMGQAIVWKSVAETDAGRQLTVIEIPANNRRRANISDPIPTDSEPGTEVIIADISDWPEGLGDGAADYFISKLAPYIEKYHPDIIFAGKRLDPAAIQNDHAEYQIEVDGIDPARLEVIEWSQTMPRALCFCNADGMALAEDKPKIHAPGFDFTAYICWSGFEDSTRILTPEMDPQSAAIIDASRAQLKTHFKERGEDERRRQVEEWKAEKVYPFDTEPRSATETASRELFDVVAVTARAAVNAGESRSKLLSLRLLREAVEKDPTSLRQVLEEVVGLPEKDLEELSKLLEQTSLTKVIEASRTITKRLDFLMGLQELVTDKELKSRLLERSQLHRILADQTWIFGEEFALTADDEGLNAALKAHIKLLGRDDLSPAELDAPVENAGDRSRAIVDLMLAREIPQNRNRLEHLVVELKRPSVAIGPREVQQIEEYAYAVANDPRFEKNEVSWDFYAISTTLTGTVPEKAKQKDKEPGLVTTFRDGTVRVWVKTWGEVIGDAKHRHKFFKERLNYSPSSQRAFKHMKEAHADFLPAAVDDRIEDPSARGSVAASEADELAS